jgi:NhaP-type Na+/H+ or K+/H+ antiporter
MKTPLRLIFGLVLGLALGYGLTLLARPAASRRVRRRPLSARTPKDVRDREPVH